MESRKKRKISWPSGNKTPRSKKTCPSPPPPERLAASLVALLQPYLCADVSRIVVDYDADVKERCRACHQLPHPQTVERCYRCQQLQHKTCLTPTDDGLLFCARCREFLGDCPECQSPITTEWTDCDDCSGFWHASCLASSTDDPEGRYCMDCWWNEPFFCPECHDEFSTHDAIVYTSCQKCYRFCCPICFVSANICVECWWHDSRVCSVCDTLVSLYDLTSWSCDKCESIVCLSCFVATRSCRVCPRLPTCEEVQ